MSTIHPYRLRPYHNPERVDESKVPPGWRLLYVGEVYHVHTGKVRKWDAQFSRFSNYEFYLGNCNHLTYIVPVEA